ncbi:hypothetical protein AHiyo4_05670 [Arthrobacter sp. Hiyo4]|nr:hypothetical protein AHiyo4_05670 [Arthrobacter sp. Hiyo4]
MWPLAARLRTASLIPLLTSGTTHGTPSTSRLMTTTGLSWARARMLSSSMRGLARIRPSTVAMSRRAAVSSVAEDSADSASTRV